MLVKSWIVVASGCYTVFQARSQGGGLMGLQPHHQKSQPHHQALSPITVVSPITCISMRRAPSPKFEPHHKQIPGYGPGPGVKWRPLGSENNDVNYTAPLTL